MSSVNIRRSAIVRKTDDRDEFYTTAESAAKMFCLVKLDQFAGKIIYCNCDGPESEIYKHLKRNFQEWKLKKLMATKFVKDGHGIKTEFDGVNETVSQLSGDGSYCSEECERLLAETDVVVTNPPFSKLGHFIPWVIEHGTDLVVIANMMVIGHQTVLKLALQKKLHVCHGGGGMTMMHNGIEVTPSSVALTTLHTKLSEEIKFRKPGFTLEELEAKSKIFYDDSTKMMCVDYVRYLPADWHSEICCPLSILIREDICDDYDVIGLTPQTVKVNGKARFYRVIVKRRMKKQ